MSRIKNSVVLITGASRGLGRQLAMGIAKKGGRVIALARNEDKLKELVSEIHEAGGEAIALPADLTDLPALACVAQKAEQVWGSVDILINNAGCVNFLPLQDYSLEEMQKLFNLNALSGIELARLLLPSMLSKKKGHIVNVSSISGKVGSPYGNVYAASKAALINWTHAQRIELQQSGVFVSLICPSYLSCLGAVVDLGLKTPKLIPKNQPERVVRLMIHAIETNQAEAVIVPGFFPARPLLALSQMFPTLQDHFFGGFGVTQSHRECAMKQVRLRNCSKG